MGPSVMFAITVRCGNRLKAWDPTRLRSPSISTRFPSADGPIRGECSSPVRTGHRRHAGRAGPLERPAARPYDAVVGEGAGRPDGAGRDEVRRFGEVSEEHEGLTYGSYLKIPDLLSLQALLSDPPAHDELLFIVGPQAYQLWV